MNKELEEDRREINEETEKFDDLYWNGTSKEQQRIQAEYTNELTDAFKKRFPDFAWFFPPGTELLHIGTIPNPWLQN